MTTFAERLAARGLDLQQRVNDRLAALATFPVGAQAVRNISAEPRLSAPQLDQLIDAINAEASIDPGFIKLRITDCLRTMKYPGGAIALPSDLEYGRAVPRDKFARRISKLPPYNRPRTIWNSVRYTLRHTPLEKLTRAWTGRPLGVWLIWSTFSLTTTDPFQHPLSSARGAMECFGLPPEDGPMIAFTYHLPSGTTTHYPAIAEAYSGDQWNFYFTPAAPGSACGQTLPWDKEPPVQPHNEVVHDVIFAEHLTPLPRVLP